MENSREAEQLQIKVKGRKQAEETNRETWREC